MIFKKSLLSLLFCFFTVQIFAHEGHDSANLKSMHGGIVKKSKTAYVEVLQEEGKIDIYISNHEYQNIVTPTLDVSAFADVKGKKIILKLNKMDNHFEINNELKNEKHFKLNIDIKLAGRKKESVVFPLEN
jgi:hypothetical protein